MEGIEKSLLRFISKDGEKTPQNQNLGSLLLRDLMQLLFSTCLMNYDENQVSKSINSCWYWKNLVIIAIYGKSLKINTSLMATYARQGQSTFENGSKMTSKFPFLLNCFQMQQERQAAIDRQNEVILNQLMKIKQSPARVDNWNKDWRPT